MAMDINISTATRRASNPFDLCNIEPIDRQGIGVCVKGKWDKKITDSKKRSKRLFCYPVNFIVRLDFF